MSALRELQLFESLPPHIEAALRVSIERFGVLVPVVKDQHGATLDGNHRSRIAAALGVKYRVDVVNVRDGAEAAEIQRTLNADRRQLTEEQRRQVVATLRQEGRHSERAIAGALGVSQPTVHRDLTRESGDSRESPDHPERSVGLDGKSYPARRPILVPARNDQEARRAQVALQALPQDALPFAHASVGQVERVVHQRRREGLLTTPVPLPDGTFRCIVIDPPWPMNAQLNREVRSGQETTLPYPSMTLDELAALPIAEKAADGCHIYLWVTHYFLPAGLRLFEAWGAKYQCLMTWVKNVGITPYSWMYDTEHVLFGRIGPLALERLGLRLSFSAPVTGHSVKPDVFYERVLEASPGPRLDMFARREHEGFTSWGNEVVG